MLRGHNSDLTIRGKSFHVQTEDWGEGNPYIVSKIFSNGAVLKTIKIAYERYAKALNLERLPKDLVRQALQEQHNRVVEDLRNNQFQI